ncbi:iron ABC transporter permease [Leptolyngbya sp. DQ-M1]|uniref:iron ABC transporter permease n=1 Tax=Leptolyngbya sp. DQ-M1 TaxID=2933920 RepID=UPI00329727B6
MKSVITGIVLLLIVLWVHLTQGQSNASFGTVIGAVFSPDNSEAQNLIRYLLLPRSLIGVLAGIALGIAGTLLQTITRNPLASPTTLGVNSGAYFAVVAGAIFVPQQFAIAPGLFAFAGGLLAAGLVYAIATSVRVTPTRLVLAGVAVSLMLSAFTATLQLVYENETAGLFLWGAGSLVQTDWSGVRSALPQILAGSAIAILFIRLWDVLLLEDQTARSLGVKVQSARFFGVVVAVFLAAIVVSVVGAVGFVGLVAPHLVRLMGVRQHLFLLPGAAVWGAVLLISADVVAQQVATNVSELAAGSVTALIGAPFLIWLARRTSPSEGGAMNDSVGSLQSRSLPGSSLYLPYWGLMTIAIGLLLLALFSGVAFGQIRFSLLDVLQALEGNAFSQQVLFDLRLSRVLVAMLAGASLSVSGLLLQGVIRNPLAGPEIIGITSGAGLFALFVLILIPNAPVSLLPIAAMLGAFTTFAIVCVIAWRDGFDPGRLALVGIAISAFCAAGINLLVVSARLQVAQALVWLSGSTYARSWDELGQLVVFPVVLLPIAWLTARWLDLIALGDDLPKLLGVRLQQARLVLMSIAVMLAAASVATVGTLGFVGLLAPHATRLLVGNYHRQLIPLSALLGAILVVIADTIGRTILAPREIPSGLITAMIGTPYFLWLLWQNRDE